MFQLPQAHQELEEFHELCTQFHLEAKLEALPNPRDMTMLRVITFQSFGDEIVRVIQDDGNSVTIPARGTAQVMLQPYEQLPKFERIE